MVCKPRYNITDRHIYILEFDNMKIGVVQNEYFSKTFTYRESPRGYYRDRQTGRNSQRSTDTYNKHNDGNKCTSRTVTEAERSRQSNKKGS